jgi:hypothetical protein
MALRKPRSTREEDALKWRAVAAWVKYDQPRVSFDDTHAAVVEINGRVYVTLTYGKRLLAAFRVRADGQLKRMRRPPRELRGDED